MSKPLDFLNKLKSLQERKPIWVTGGTDALREAAGELTAALAARAGREVWTVRQDDRSFQSYRGFRTLLQYLIPVVEQERPQLMEDFAHLLRHVVPERFQEEGEPEVPLSADAVTFAIIRRISRESLQTPELIDAGARFFLEAKRTCPSLQRDVEIIMHDFDWVDRPSLRILFRIQVLALAEDGLFWTMLMKPTQPGAEPLMDDTMESRLTQARRLILTRIFHDLEPELVDLGPATDAYDYSKAYGKVIEGEGDLLTATAHHLVHMNYDRAYLVAQQALVTETDAVKLSDVHRLIGLIDANIGDFRSAHNALTRSLELASSPTLRAHLNYLIGLLYTKRFRDLEIAENYFAKGMKCLEGLSEDDPDVALEKAWLMNGQGFARTLKAKALPTDAREAELQKTVLHEISAYQIARKGRSSALIYLRYNLLANIAFLLEIVRQYGEASKFWERAFQPYLDGSESDGFQMIYHYRQAMLMFRNGERENAVAHIVKSLHGATLRQERFLEERVRLGYGYIAFQTGNFAEAFELYEKGLQLAWELRNWNAMVEHAMGWLWSALQMDDIETVSACVELITLIPGKKEQGLKLGEAVAASGREQIEWALRTAGFHLQMPSPKLPAYLPSIDLEMAPNWDINRYLVAEETDGRTLAEKSV